MWRQRSTENHGLAVMTLLRHRVADTGVLLTELQRMPKLKPKSSSSAASQLIILTAAAMAALRRSRRLAQVLLRIKVELLFALGAAEVIRLPFVLGSSSGGSRFYVHAAHKDLSQLLCSSLSSLLRRSRILALALILVPELWHGEHKKTVRNRTARRESTHAP